MHRSHADDPQQKFMMPARLQRPACMQQLSVLCRAASVARAAAVCRAATLCCAAVFSMSWSVASYALPDSVPNLQVAQWASSCVTCHGAARPVRGSAIPSLAGRSAARIENAMKAYASGTRPGLLMQQIAKGCDPAVVRAIAQWYAQLAVEKVEKP